MIKKAYIIAELAHRQQKRQSGEPYFEHPIEVAKILMELKADSSTICAALLHDVVEDTSMSIEKVREMFGDEIATLVSGVTKIDKIHFENKDDYTAENLRKILLATAKDIRVMLIRLADRLHNMRTLKYFKEEKQIRISQETMEIYAPIAHKLGMWRIKGELEDLSLRYLKPEVYRMLTEKINEKRIEREKRTADMVDIISNALKEKGIDAKIYGRAKYFYSIYRKMKKYECDFNEIYDLMAIRVITKTVSECYAAMGILHELYKPIHKRFKDYIAVPKSNGYQSLHTTLVTPHGKILEVQIRTEEMHRIAEDGIAAHWLYKGTERDKRFDKKISWLKQLLEWKRSNANAREFIDSLKIDLFEKEIVVFTPKGDPISLPEDATPVDFAYEVHSSIGSKCSKAKVNNQLVPLDHKLRSGDVVEIITAKNVVPSRQWLKFVVTSKAKQKIRSELKIESDKDPKAIRAQKEIEEQRKNVADYLEVEGKKKPIKLSKCCNPNVGDPIVGFYTKDNRITVHKEDCINIHSLSQNKKANVIWIEEKLTGNKSVKAFVEDRVGVLAEILNLIAREDINIKKINTRQSKELVVITLELGIDTEEAVESLRQKIRSIKSVVDVK